MVLGGIAINKREVGSVWEQRVADYLLNEGYIVLDMNYRTRYSEIDVIAQDREELVFIEVKYRSDARKGHPLEAINSNKIKRIKNAALFYLRDHGYIIDQTMIRFDAIGILGNEMTHIKNAF